MSARPAAPESLVSRRRSALAATTGPRRKKPIDYSCSAETSTPPIASPAQRRRNRPSCHDIRRNT